MQLRSLRSPSFIAATPLLVAALTLTPACDGGSDSGDSTSSSTSSESGSESESSTSDSTESADTSDTTDTTETTGDGDGDGDTTGDGDGDASTHAFDMTVTWPGHTASFTYTNDGCPEQDELYTQYHPVTPENVMFMSVGCQTGMGTPDMERVVFSLYGAEGGGDNQAFVGETGTFTFANEPTRRLTVGAFKGPSDSLTDGFNSFYASEVTGTLTIDTWDVATRRVTGTVDVSLTDADDPSVVAMAVGSFDFTYAPPL